MYQPTSLTEHGRQCLIHLNRAQEPGLSREYTAARGMKSTTCIRAKAS